MNADDYVAALRRDGAALTAAAEGNLRREVSACPGWDVSELVAHTGEVHRFWGDVVARRLQNHEDVRPQRRPAGDDLLPWFDQGVEELAATLSAADPAEAVWTWSAQNDAAFVQRRMAQETAVHRWDAQAAAGRPRPVPAELAVDGVDEFLDFMLVSEPERLAGASESVHLHATDAPGEWMIRFEHGVADVDRTHGKAAVAVRGPASDLLLLLWRRLPASAVETIGDASSLERFLGRADLD